jgi:hypothetical protein
MDTIHKRWKKQLDDFDSAVDPLPSLEQEMRVWVSFAPAVHALFDAVMRERIAYKATAGELRQWMDAHEKDIRDPEEFGRRLRATIEAARRLKGVLDAFNREKAVAEAAYPEMAGGSLKDTRIVGLGVPVEESKPADDAAVRTREASANPIHRAPEHASA